jgi:hypothetical protein
MCLFFFISLFLIINTFFFSASRNLFKTQGGYHKSTGASKIVYHIVGSGSHVEV